MNCPHLYGNVFQSSEWIFACGLYLEVVGERGELSGWTVAAIIIRPVYVDLQAPFKEVKGQQRAEVTSQ